MEGKVELPIERYEELTKLERDGDTRVAELEANMDTVIVKRQEWCNEQIIKTFTEYVPKSEEFQKLVNAKKFIEGQLDDANRVKGAINQQLQTYRNASFGKRFKYLWTGKL